MFFGLFPSKKEEKASPDTQKNKTPETNQNPKTTQPEPQTKNDMNFFDSLQVKKNTKAGQKTTFDPFGMGSNSNTTTNSSNPDPQPQFSQQSGFESTNNMTSSGFSNQQQEASKSTGSKKFSKFTKKPVETESQPTFISNANFESLGMEDPAQKIASLENAETTSNHSGSRSEKSDHSSQQNQEIPLTFKKTAGFDPFGMEKPKQTLNPFEMGGFRGKSDSEIAELRQDPVETQPNTEPVTISSGPKKFGKFTNKSQSKEESVASREDSVSTQSEKYETKRESTPPKREQPKVEKPKEVLPQPISAPSHSESETPEMVNMRLEVERNNLLEKIGDLIIQQSGLMTKKNALDEERNNIQRNLQHVTQQQEEAVEKENFEFADELEVVINQRKESIKRISKESDECQMSYAEIEKEKQMLYQQEYMIYKNWIAAIEKITLTQHHNFERYKSECLNQQQNEKSYVDEESQKLQLKRNHIELDLKHIADETNQYNENLSKQTKDYVSEQQQLSSKKIELEVLIDQIRKELAAREKELAETTNSLDKVTSKINGIKSKFDDHLRKLDDKRDKVGQEENKYDADMKRLERYKDNAENNLRIYEDNVTRAQRMFDEYEKIKNFFNVKSHSIQSENDKREEALTSYYNSLSELSQVKSQYDFVQTEIEKLKQDSTLFQKEISDYSQEKNNLESKIPQLEKDKKAYASTRNFKEASRVSNEIKDIQTKLEEVATHLNQKLSLDKATCEKIALHEKQNIPGFEKKIQNLQEKCDKNRYHFLVIREADLRALKQHYLDQKQYEDLNVIESELRDAVQQIESLKIKYRDLSSNQPHQERPQAHAHAHDHEEYKQEEVSAQQEYKEENECREEVVQHVEEEEVVPVQTETAPAEEKTLPEYLAEYDTLDAEDKHLDSVVEKLANEDKFEEAESYSTQLEQIKARKNEILDIVSGFGFDTIDALRESLGQNQPDSQNEGEAEPRDEN